MAYTFCEVNIWKYEFTYLIKGERLFENLLVTNPQRGCLFGLEMRGGERGCFA